MKSKNVSKRMLSSMKTNFVWTGAVKFLYTILYNYFYFSSIVVVAVVVVVFFLRL